MTEEQLKTMFSEAGNVASVKIITDRQTGLPRGFGFVEMETKLEGQTAISKFNGMEVEGRALAVNEAKPQQRTASAAVAAATAVGAAAAVVGVAAVAGAAAAITVSLSPGLPGPS